MNCLYSKEIINYNFFITEEEAREGRSASSPYKLLSGPSSLAHKGPMWVHALYPVHKFHGPASAFPEVPQLLCAHKHLTGASTHPAPCQQTCIQSSCAPSHMPPQGGSNIQTSGSQSVVMSPRPKLFHDHTKQICALFTLILSWVHSGVFQRLCDT